MTFSAKQHPITSAFLREWRSEFPGLEPYYRAEGGEEFGYPSTGEYVQIHVEPKQKK
jgi:hypothetical protein